MDPAAIAAALEGLPTGLLALRSLRHRPNQPDGPRPGAAEAYLAYEAAALEVVFNMQFLLRVGVPPPLSGGAWSYPLAWRAHRRFLDGAEGMVVAFGQMVMLGTEEAVDAAYEVAVALAAAVMNLPLTREAPTWWPFRYWPRQRLTWTDDIEERFHQATVAIRGLVLACRSDIKPAS